MRCRVGPRRPGRNREVPLSAKAKNAIRLWAEQFPERHDDHFIFPSEHVGAGGDHFDARIRNTNPAKRIGTLKTAWKTAKAEAGVKVRWHDLRHTAVTRLLEQSHSLPMVASIMGWSASTTVRMVERYGHISPDARREAMESMNAPRVRVTETNEDATVIEPDKSAVH